MSQFQKSNSLQQMVELCEKMYQARNENDLFKSEDEATHEYPMSGDFTSLASDYGFEKFSNHSSDVSLNEVRDNAVACIFHNDEVQNATESDEVTFVRTISNSDARIVSSQVNEDATPYVESESSSPTCKEFADVFMQSDYQTFAALPSSNMIMKAMGIMKIKNRERGSVYVRGKHIILL